MSYTHILSMAQEKYELFLSNTEIEDKLPDNIPSSAGFFVTPVNIDLEPLLFLRSASAKLSLSYLTIDSLALAYTRIEDLNITLSIPPEILQSNLVFTPDLQMDQNKKSFDLNFTDFTAPQPDDALDYLNKLFRPHMNIYIAYRLSIGFFDKDVFKQDLFSTASLLDPIDLTVEDIDLLLRYVDILAYTRQIYAVILAGGDESKKPAFTFSKLGIVSEGIKKPIILTKELEKPVLKRSRTLKTFGERRQADSKEPFHLTYFQWFYGEDIEGTNNPLTNKIKTHLNTVLHDIAGIELNPTTNEDREQLNGLKDSNLKLIAQGETIRRILLIERSKLSNPPLPSLFNTEFLSVSKDETATKAKFLINNTLLPPDETAISIIFPKQASYCLGGSPLDNYLRIGPISSLSDTLSIKSPHFSNVITSRTQRLPSAIRNHPKLVKLSTNILSASDNRDLWPQNPDFPEFQTIFCISIDESTFQQRFIHKNTSELEYHRLLRSENSLQQIALLTTDQCGRVIFFPRNTYLYAAIRLEALSKD